MRRKRGTSAHLPTGQIYQIVVIIHQHGHWKCLSPVLHHPLYRCISIDSIVTLSVFTIGLLTALLLNDKYNCIHLHCCQHSDCSILTWRSENIAWLWAGVNLHVAACALWSDKMVGDCPVGASLYSRGDPCVYPPLAVCVSACSPLPSNLSFRYYIQPAGGW